MNIGFIGLGNMAKAMIGGILRKNIISPEDIGNQRQGFQGIRDYHR